MAGPWTVPEDILIVYFTKTHGATPDKCEKLLNLKLGSSRSSTAIRTRLGRLNQKDDLGPEKVEQWLQEQWQSLEHPNPSLTERDEEASRILEEGEYASTLPTRGKPDRDR